MPFTHPDRLFRVAGGEDEEEGKELSCRDPEDCATLPCPYLLILCSSLHEMLHEMLENICLSGYVDEDINQTD